MNTGPGNAEAYGPEKHDLRWTVRWSSSETNATNVENGSTQITTGLMKDVAGTMYGKDGKPSLTFRAETAVGDKLNSVLRLHGNVAVTSVQRKETLTSDAAAYDARAKLVRATGNVRFKGNVGTMGTFSELTATSDFKKVATPDMFETP